MKGCAARQISDQMNCHRCGLVWDTNDPEPPKCRSDQSERLRRQELVERQFGPRVWANWFGSDFTVHPNGTVALLGWTRTQWETAIKFYQENRKGGHVNIDLANVVDTYMVRAYWTAFKGSEQP